MPTEPGNPMIMRTGQLHDRPKNNECTDGLNKETSPERACRLVKILGVTFLQSLMA